MNKLLSIAIPTYNRYKELEKTLKNLIMQIETNNLSDIIEIAISDNASTDNTELVVNKFLKKYPNIIKYNRNNTNILWKNFKKVSEIATGKFIWFCGDDDVYFFNTVKKIIDILQENNVDAIYLNQVNSIGYTTPIAEDCIVNLDEFFKLTRQDSEFISTVIVKRELINPDIKIFTWYHMACLLNLPKSAKCFITHNPYVYNKPSVRNWVNHQNLINYTIDAIETILDSNASEETKLNLTKIYTILLKRRIINAQLKTKEKDTNNSQYIKRIINISQRIGINFLNIIIFANSKFICKVYYHFIRRKKIKLPFGKTIMYIDAI